MEFNEKLNLEGSLGTALIEDMKEAIHHGMLISNLAFLLSKELGMNRGYCYSMGQAGLVHDIGKLKLGKYLYGRKEDALVIEEMKYVRMHSTFSYEILKSYGYSNRILMAVRHHHENYDGSGYPDNLAGTAIPWGARILRTCDVFGALISDRHYRTAFDTEQAIELMIDEVKNFDMKVFLAFQRVVHSKEFHKIKVQSDEFDCSDIDYHKLQEQMQTNL